MASAVPGFLRVDSVDSNRDPPFPERWLRKPLKMSRNLSRAGARGFRVDSPVKRPDASKVPGCAPPYTFMAREEPEEGGDLQNTWGRCSLARSDQEDRGSTNVSATDQPDVLHEDSLFCHSWFRIMR